eukprot:m.44123 g.44123  ORF g.44123 m.44123 type:complete len:1107 (-) comp10049_c0_seq2:3213-6533(-)
MEDNCVDNGSESDQISTGFLLFYPGVHTNKVSTYINKLTKGHKIDIVNHGYVSSQVVNEENIFNKSFAQFTKYATNVEVTCKEYLGLWHEYVGSSEEHSVFMGCQDACRLLGLKPEFLNTLWSKGKQPIVKLDHFCFCCALPESIQKASNTPDKIIYVLNGFYPLLRESFMDESSSFAYYVLQWSSRNLSWKQFNRGIVGDGASLYPGSLRQILQKHWKSFGLKHWPDWYHLGMHSSQSPLQALIDQSMWLGVRMERDEYGRRLLQAGIGTSQFKKWMSNPLVQSKGLQESGKGPKQDYIFNIVSSMEPDKCTSTCLKLANIDKSMRDEGATTIQSAWRSHKHRKDYNSFRNLRNETIAWARGFLNLDSGKESRSEGERNFGLLMLYSAGHRSVHLLLEVLRACHINVSTHGEMGANDIQESFLNLFFAHEIRYMQGETLSVPSKEFSNRFDTTWQDVLSSRRAYVACDAAKELGTSEEELVAAWLHAVDRNKVVTCRNGMSVGEISLMGHSNSIFIWGGNYLVEKHRLVKPGASTHFFAVDWEVGLISWTDFRKKLIGVGKQKKQLNSIFYDARDILQIQMLDNDADDLLFLGVSQTKAMLHRAACTGSPIESEPLGKALLDEGYNIPGIQSIAEDPEIQDGNVSGRLLSRATRDMDFKACVRYCLSLRRQLEPRISKTLGKEHISNNGQNVSEENANLLREKTFVKEANELELTKTLRIGDMHQPADIDRILLALQEAKPKADMLSLCHLVAAHLNWSPRGIKLSQLVSICGTYFFGPKHQTNPNDNILSDIRAETLETLDALGLVVDELESVTLPSERLVDKSPLLAKEVFPTVAHRWATAWLHLRQFRDDFWGSEEDKYKLDSRPLLHEQFGTMSEYVQLGVLEDISSIQHFVSSVDFSGIGLVDADIALLSKTLVSDTKIQVLGLYDNRITAAGARHIANLLKNTKHLCELSLSVNQIADDGAIALAEALCVNTSLLSLQLSDNRIGDAGVVALCSALNKGNTSLTDIDFTANKIGLVGGDAIIELMRETGHITGIALLGNPGLPMSVISIIRKMGQINQIKKISKAAKKGRKAMVLSAGTESSLTVSGNSSGSIQLEFPS